MSDQIAISIVQGLAVGAVVGCAGWVLIFIFRDKIADWIIRDSSK